MAIHEIMIHLDRSSRIGPAHNAGAERMRSELFFKITYNGSSAIAFMAGQALGEHYEPVAFIRLLGDQLHFLRQGPVFISRGYLLQVQLPRQVLGIIVSVLLCGCIFQHLSVIRRFQQAFFRPGGIVDLPARISRSRYFRLIRISEVNIDSLAPAEGKLIQYLHLLHLGICPVVIHQAYFYTVCPRGYFTTVLLFRDDIGPWMPAADDISAAVAFADHNLDVIVAVAARHVLTAENGLDVLCPEFPAYFDRHG